MITHPDTTALISPEKPFWYGEAFLQNTPGTLYGDALAFARIPIFRREVMGGVT